MSHPFKLVPLFGGAMACEVPAAMTDVSDVRQVPDNQEVYNDIDTGATIIVELLSRHAAVSDEAAAEFFFRDLATANGCDGVEDGVQVLSAATLPPSAYPLLARQQQPGGEGQVCAYAGLACGVQKISKYTNEAGSENDVFVGLAALRFLPRVTTDILVSLSAPQRLHPGSSEAAEVKRLLSAEERIAILRAAVASLRVNDWGLFVPED